MMGMDTGFLAHETWTNMFVLDHKSVTLAEKILRPIFVYFCLIFLLRLFGKRELGQLNPFDLIVILSLSNTVQNAIIGEDNSLIGGIVGAAALLGINYLIAVVKFRSNKVERFFEGKPLVLIENSQVNEKAMRRELMTREDLDVIAHRESLGSADEIEKCIVDPNGEFLVEGNTPTSEENFRSEVLRQLQELTQQVQEIKERS